MLASYEDRIEASASRFRAWAKHENEAVPDVVTWVQKLKHEQVIADYRRVPDLGMPDDEGIFDADTGVLILRESTFCNASEFARSRDYLHRRARFTIAHEIAHIWLRHSGIRHRNTTGRMIDRFDRQRRVDERHANRFAGAALIGRNLVNLSQAVTLLDLEQRFVVNEKVAEVRLEELQSMRRRELGILRPLPPGIEEAMRRMKEQNKRRDR